MIISCMIVTALLAGILAAFTACDKICGTANNDNTGTQTAAEAQAETGSQTETAAGAVDAVTSATLSSIADPTDVKIDIEVPDQKLNTNCSTAISIILISFRRATALTRL